MLTNGRLEGEGKRDLDVRWGGSSVGIDATVVRGGGGERMKKGDVCFRGWLCSVHLKISFVAAEGKKEKKKKQGEEGPISLRWIPRSVKRERKEWE